MQGYKTFLFSAVLMILGVLEKLDWLSVLTPQNAGFVLTGIGAATAVLRLFTSTAPGQKA